MAVSGIMEIPVVQDQEEEDLIKQVQKLECEERKAELKERVRLMQERAKDPLRHLKPTAGGTPGGLPYGPGGSPRSSLSPEDHERELSKWSYKDFFEPNVRKEPTYQEFMAAALLWGSEAVNASGDELSRYLHHLAYVAQKAAVKDSFVDKAHIHYDEDVRKKCVLKGWEAFCKGDAETSMVRYGYTYTESYRRQQEAADRTADNRKSFAGASSISSSRPRKGKSRAATTSSDGTNACVKHNFDDGGYDNDRCRFAHECRKCGDVSHVQPKCPKK